MANVRRDLASRELEIWLSKKFRQMGFHIRPATPAGADARVSATSDPEDQGYSLTRLAEEIVDEVADHG